MSSHPLLEVLFLFCFVAVDPCHLYDHKIGSNIAAKIVYTFFI